MYSHMKEISLKMRIAFYIFLSNFLHLLHIGCGAEAFFELQIFLENRAHFLHWYLLYDGALQNASTVDKI